MNPIRAATLALCLVATAGIGGWATGWMDGPWGMLPGGRLQGPGTSCGPVRWAEFADVREVEIEVRPRRPRSLTTWSVVHGGEMFLPADFLTPWKRWPRQVLEDDRIRIRLRGRILDCRAERVTDPALIERLREATANKYRLESDGRAADVEVWWYRVRPR